MKRLLAIILLFSAPALAQGIGGKAGFGGKAGMGGGVAAGGTPASVQAPCTNHDLGGGNTTTCVFGNNVAAHSAIAVFSWWFSINSDLTSVTDANSDTYTLVQFLNAGGSFGTNVAYTCDTGTGGFKTLTLHFSTTEAVYYTQAFEISNVATSSCLNAHAQVSSVTAGTGTAMDSTSVSTSQASVFQIGFGGTLQAGVSATGNNGQGGTYLGTGNNGFQDAGSASESLYSNTGTNSYKATFTAAGNSDWTAYFLAFH